MSLFESCMRHDQYVDNDVRWLIFSVDESYLLIFVRSLLHNAALGMQHVLLSLQTVLCCSVCIIALRCLVFHHWPGYLDLVWLAALTTLYRFYYNTVRRGNVINHPKNSIRNTVSSLATIEHLACLLMSQIDPIFLKAPNVGGTR